MFTFIRFVMPHARRWKCSLLGNLVACFKHFSYDDSVIENMPYLSTSTLLMLIDHITSIKGRLCFCNVNRTAFRVPLSVRPPFPPNHTTPHIPSPLLPPRPVWCWPAPVHHTYRLWVVCGEPNSFFILFFILFFFPFTIIMFLYLDYSKATKML